MLKLITDAKHLLASISLAQIAQAHAQQELADPNFNGIAKFDPVA